MAFKGCSGLTSINIPEGVTSIGETVFEGCSGLTSVKILEGGVTRIPEYTSYGCYRLVSVKIPSSVTSIGEGAFQRCSALPSICIPEGVTKISESAFSICDKLSTIYSLNPVPPTAELSSFGGLYQSATLYVPQEAMEAYRTADTWSNFQNIQGFDPTGIKGVEAEDGNRPAAYYDANGRISATPHHGVNIVRLSDGTTRKIMMK